jgi:hypothetical protein
VAYSACFVLAGEDEVSSVSMSDFLIRCLLRFPSLRVSGSIELPIAQATGTVFLKIAYRADLQSRIYLYLYNIKWLLAYILEKTAECQLYISVVGLSSLYF